jgi:hypothetical protein
MTKKELKQKMLDFINRQDDNVKDEWYATNRGVYKFVIEEFAKEEFGIDLEK